MSTSPTRASIEHFRVKGNDDLYHFEPVCCDGGPVDTLQITRPDGLFAINAPLKTSLPLPLLFTSYGILGVFRLLAGIYVIVVTERTHVGSILGNDVWRIEGTRILPCASISSLALELQVEEEAYIALLNKILTSKHFYYSSTYDLTTRLQAQFEHTAACLPTVLDWRSVDQRFLANRVALSGVQIVGSGEDGIAAVGRFVIVCIQGFVETQLLDIKDKSVQLTLVSRRATGRVGTRYHSRGIDDHGHVSNCVETEQIAVHDGTAAAFVQIRGSIPVYWRQTVNLRYSPPFELYNAESEGAAVFAAHFEHLVHRYGDVVAVNLVNRDGWEGRLAAEYARRAANLGADARVRYVHFDFHRECRGMHWENIARLIASIGDDLRQHAFLLARIGDPVGMLSRQTGIIRANCIDCLDRTNVVQSVLAENALEAQLREMGVLKAQVGDAPTLHQSFKHLWADNADAISTQYSGTGALKTDFTRYTVLGLDVDRTGRRTGMGVLQDGLNSIRRYYLNNFTDGFRQDAMDLFFGAYDLTSDKRLKFLRRPVRSTMWWYAPLTVLLSVLYGTALLFGQAPLALTRRQELGITLAVASFGAAFILANGMHFVQYPQLNRPAFLGDPAPAQRSAQPHLL